jgi:ABC-type cobalamin transport system ATPase subunit
MPQKQTIRFPEVHGTYATETKTVPEVYADIPQKQTNQFQKCMLTYTTETEHKSPRTSSWDQVASVVAIAHKLVSRISYNLQTCVAFVASHSYYQCCFLPKSKLLD